MQKSIILIVIILGSIFCFVRSFAQVTSSAFDPNCYQPIIGTSGVVDTIYGARQLDAIGTRIKNLWPQQGESYGRIVIGESFNSPNKFPIYNTGPTLNLHNLHAIDTFKLWPSYNPDIILQRGHFRSKKYFDILYKYSSTSIDPARIYWADEQGNYDTSRYTLLETKLQPGYRIFYGAMQPYTTYLSSDSVEDIIYGVSPIIANAPDSVFLAYYRGGQKLKDQGIIAYSDSIQFFDTSYQGTELRKFSHGDYRGVGREDLIASNENVFNGNGDVFYYKNDLPFSLQNFVSSIKYDTLMAKWQNPNYGSQFGANQFSMRAFRKQLGDSSVDFMPTFGQIYIYKGGPDFGSHRLFENKADFIIHHPSYYDSRWSLLGFPGMMYDCGDMTGTGNRVLFVSGSIDAGFEGYFFFYVLGDAMDDKVDMYMDLDNNGSINDIDTLTADGDNLQDVMLGMPSYGKDNGNESNGTVWVVHGSTNIPVKVNGVPKQNTFFR